MAYTVLATSETFLCNLGLYSYLWPHIAHIVMAPSETFDWLVHACLSATIDVRIGVRSDMCVNMRVGVRVNVSPRVRRHVRRHVRSNAY